MRVCKDVRVQRVNGEVAILRVLRVKGDGAILRVQRVKGDVAILRVRKMCWYRRERGCVCIVGTEGKGGRAYIDGK